MRAVIWLASLGILVFSSCMPKWRLVWSDEFRKDGLPNRRFWNYEKGFVRNFEEQEYKRARVENSRVESGKLIIESRLEEDANSYLTSASLITRNKKEFLYGRIEVRAKLPTGIGTWPAIWMLSKKKSKSGLPIGEIDIMENVGYDPDVIHGTIHINDADDQIIISKGGKTKVFAPYENFHVYSLQWSPDSLSFFVDDRNYFTYSKKEVGNEYWVFDDPHYLLINLAVGGSWGGQRGVDFRIFPQQLVIDYVRYYKWK